MLVVPLITCSRCILERNQHGDKVKASPPPLLPLLLPLAFPSPARPLMLMNNNTHTRMSMLVAIAALLLISSTAGFTARPLSWNRGLCRAQQTVPTVHHIAKKTNADANDDAAQESKGVMGVFKKSPSTLVVIPFVALFGLDLILNIAVVTKRSLEGKSRCFVSLHEMSCDCCCTWHLLY